MTASAAPRYSEADDPDQATGAPGAGRSGPGAGVTRPQGIDVDALRERLRRLDDTARRIPGLTGRWATTRALTGGLRAASDELELLAAHGLLRWSRGAPGCGLVWQRTQHGARWMRGHAKRVPPAPALTVDVRENHGSGLRVVRVSDPLGYGALAILLGSCEDGHWYAHDSASRGARAPTPAQALREFASRAAEDARADSQAIRAAGARHDALRDLVDEATRVLAHRADRLLAHVLEHADAIAAAVVAAGVEDPRA